MWAANPRPHKIGAKNDDSNQTVPRAFVVNVTATNMDDFDTVVRLEDFYEKLQLLIDDEFADLLHLEN